VRYFKAYHLDQDNLELPAKEENQAVRHLVGNFDPDNDVVDKRILYEITGRKGENERYSDEEGDSSDEDN